MNHKELKAKEEIAQWMELWRQKTEQEKEAWIVSKSGQEWKDKLEKSYQDDRFLVEEWNLQRSRDPKDPIVDLEKKINKKYKHLLTVKNQAGLFKWNGSKNDLQEHLTERLRLKWNDFINQIDLVDEDSRKNYGCYADWIWLTMHLLESFRRNDSSKLKEIKDMLIQDYGISVKDWEMGLKAIKAKIDTRKEEWLDDWGMDFDDRIDWNDFWMNDGCFEILNTAWKMWASKTKVGVKEGAENKKSVAHRVDIEILENFFEFYSDGSLEGVRRGFGRWDWHWDLIRKIKNKDSFVSTWALAFRVAGMNGEDFKLLDEWREVLRLERQENGRGKTDKLETWAVKKGEFKKKMWSLEGDGKEQDWGVIIENEDGKEVFCKIEEEPGKSQGDPETGLIEINQSQARYWLESGLKDEVKETLNVMGLGWNEAFWKTWAMERAMLELIGKEKYECPSWLSVKLQDWGELRGWNNDPERIVGGESHFEVLAEALYSMLKEQLKPDQNPEESLKVRMQIEQESEEERPTRLSTKARKLMERLLVKKGVELNGGSVESVMKQWLSREYEVGPGLWKTWVNNEKKLMSHLKIIEPRAFTTKEDKVIEDLTVKGKILQKLDLLSREIESMQEKKRKEEVREWVKVQQALRSWGVQEESEKHTSIMNCYKESQTRGSMWDFRGVWDFKKSEDENKREIQKQWQEWVENKSFIRVNWIKELHERWDQAVGDRVRVKEKEKMGKPISKKELKEIEREVSYRLKVLVGEAQDAYGVLKYPQESGEARKWDWGSKRPLTYALQCHQDYVAILNQQKMESIPNEVMSSVLEELKERAPNWEGWKDLKEDKTLRVMEMKIKNVKVVELNSVWGLIAEGGEMNHCVASYHSDLRSGKWVAFHLLDLESKEKSTLSLKYIGRTWEVDQHLGVCNQWVNSENLKEIEKMLKSAMNSQKLTSRKKWSTKEIEGIAPKKGFKC